MEGSWKSGSRVAVAALVLGLGLSACTPRADDGAASGKQAEAGPGGRSALGSFLAARFAQTQGDSRAAAEYYFAALKHDPENLDLMQRAFTLMVAEGRIDEAVPLAERLLVFDADAAIPLLVMGVREAREGRFAAAEQRFAALPKRGVNSFLGPLMAAWSRAGQGRTDAALEALHPLADTKGLTALHAFHVGLINDLAERGDAAEKAYQTALAGQAGIRTVEAAGTFFQRSGRAERAREIYERYHREHPDTLLFDARALLIHGTQAPRAVATPRSGMAEALFDTATLMRQGNAYDLAMVFARLAVALEHDFPLAQMLLADILAAQERLPEANAIYRAINPASPVHVFGRLRVAVHLDEMGDTDGALKELSAMAEARPNAIDSLVAKGDLLRRHKRFEDSAAAYDAAIRRLPQVEGRHWSLFYSRGISHERAHQWPKAEADFLKALDLRPDQPDVLNYLGYSWVDQGVQVERAKAMIEKAVQLRPNDGAIVDSLGWALYRLGDYHGAVKTLERAVELRPEDPTINDHLGDAYWQVGRLEEAAIQWKRALSLDPEPEQVDPIRAKIATGTVPAAPLRK